MSTYLSPAHFKVGRSGKCISSYRLDEVPFLFHLDAIDFDRIFVQEVFIILHFLHT